MIKEKKISVVIFLSIFLLLSPASWTQISLRRIKSTTGSSNITVGLSQVGLDDILLVGGKAANLGELNRLPAVNVPEGFVVTTEALELFFNENPELKKLIAETIERIDWEDPRSINNASEKIKYAILAAHMPKRVVEEITANYRKLEEQFGTNLPVAVRSSGISEDAPDASWAGQFRTELNQRSVFQVISAVQLLWSELFNPDVLSYGHQHNIDFTKFSMGVIIQRMIDASDESSGVGFGLEPDTGFRALPGIVAGVYYIEGVPGLGEGLVQNIVEPDGFLVVKKENGEFKIISKRFGSKEVKVIAKEGMSGTEVVETPEEVRNNWIFTEEKILEIAQAIDQISSYYGRAQDTEFAIQNGKVYFVQSRAETRYSLLPVDLIRWEKKIVNPQAIRGLEPLIKGTGVGGKGAGVGKVVIIDHNSPVPVREQAAHIRKGDVLVAYRTDPSLVDAMRRAGLIITEIGGMNSHAAIVSREYDLNTIIGAKGAMSVLTQGQIVTVDAERGAVWAGSLPLIESKNEYRISELPITEHIKIGTLAFDPTRVRSMFPMALYEQYYGIGLMRLEFTLAEIGLHPLLVIAYDKYKKGEELRPEVRQIVEKHLTEIEEKIRGYASARDFFVDKIRSDILANAITLDKGQVVIVRTSDYKTNEYEDQIGGEFEELLGRELFGIYPESDPMKGFRGIERMLHERILPAFDMELEAILKAWAEEPDKVNVMIPVVRIPQDVKEFRELLQQKIAEMGLSHLGMPKLIMMFEVPSNIFQIQEFIKAGVDGFSFGTNDLTQFLLAVDRDSGLFKNAEQGQYDAVNRAVIKALGIAIKEAKGAGISTGICGQAPSDYPDVYPAILTELGIESVSVTHDVFDRVVRNIARAEVEGGAERYLHGLEMVLYYEDAPNPLSFAVPVISADEVFKKIGIHPLALHAFDNRTLGNREVAEKITRRIGGRSALRYYRNQIYNYVKESLQQKGSGIRYKSSGLMSTEYRKLIGGELFESQEANPTLGAFGLYRLLHYREMPELFRIELTAVLEAVRDSGKKIKFEFDVVRTIKELEDAISLLEDIASEVGINRDKIKIGMRVTTPANILLLEQYITHGDLDFISIDRELLASNILAAYPLELLPGDKIEDALQIPLKLIRSIAEKMGIPILTP